MIFGSKTKKLALSSVLIFLFLVAVPAMAALVTCGNDASDPCTFNDLFAMVNTVINFILFDIVPPIAAFGIVVAAITLMTSGGDPTKFEQAKRAITWMVIGLVVVYGAWFLVTSFISILGGKGWTLYFFNTK